jgi:hypothetical protein
MLGLEVKMGLYVEGGGSGNVGFRSKNGFVCGRER